MDRSLNGQHFLRPVTPVRARLGAFVFSRYAAGILGFNLFIIIWGAFVRASGSGDGCGSHWPTCGGALVPNTRVITTLIEFFHRATSGIDITLTSIMLVLAFVLFPSRHPVRTGAVLSMIALMGEAVIGAVLVLFHLVGSNSSTVRACVMSGHLTVSLLLVASLAVTYLWSQGAPALKLRGQGAVGWLLGSAVAGVVLISISGAIAAMGDTLYPASNLAAALHADIAPTTHILIRLRVIHPLLALSVALYVVLVCGLMTALRPSPQVSRYAAYLQTLVFVQLGLGLINVVLLAPIWMQLTHLLVSELLWLSLILMTASALAVDVPQVEMTTETADDASIAAAPTYKDYFALTKPRVISLLLFTTWTGMVIAARGWPGLTLFLATGIGLYMAAGSSNAINMVLERDLDVRMERTSRRPTVTHKIPPRDALMFAFLLAIGSFALLWVAANLLAALMALSGLVVYVVVYTLLLKRRTWQNIVIGGAAGAFPPLVGYAAVAGNLTPLAWSLFAIVFLWTPVHFWALAILIKDDYAKAGVPMLPCVKSERFTVAHIIGYAVLTAAISAVPLFLGVSGQLYIVSAIVLNGVLLWQSLGLWRQATRPRAGRLFHFSMLYLALLFLAMAVDRSFWMARPSSPSMVVAQAHLRGVPPVS